MIDKYAKAEKMSKNKYVKATRKMLYNYSNLFAQLGIKNMELKMLRSNDGISGISYGNIGSSGITSKVESTGERNIETEQQLLREIDTLESNIEKINSVMQILNDTERDIIHMRFIDCNRKDWGYVADYVGYSVRQSQRIENDALEKITSLLFGAKSFVDLPLFNKELQG